MLDPASDNCFLIPDVNESNKFISGITGCILAEDKPGYAGIQLISEETRRLENAVPVTSNGDHKKGQPKDNTAPVNHFRLCS